MTRVEELRHHLVIWMADTGVRSHPEGWREDLADAEREVDALISSVRDERREDEKRAGLDSIRYAIWAAYFKALYELMATGMKKAEATAVMGELPKFYGDALPIKEKP